MPVQIQPQIIEHSGYRGKILGGKRFWRILTLGLCAVVAITILLDFIHSQLRNYSFYLSETLLFKAFWILFLPVIFIQFVFLKKAKLKPYQRGGSGILRVSITGNLQIAEHNIILGLNVPDYPNDAAGK